MKIIDLRSDTVTQPCDEMRRVMANAEVGDDVTGDDPTVSRLEQYAAELLGKEAGLFVPSGTQSNLIALMSHCQRGDEYIVGSKAHCYWFEGGGAAVLGSIQPQTIVEQADGSLDLSQVAAVIKPDDQHFAKTRLLCLENTTWGRPLPMAYLTQAASVVKDHQLAMHLDGARVFNAAVHHGVDVKRITQHFDTVSMCLSKGLAAPVGSVLVGSEKLIATARRWRKMLGGGMRQSGILAAAGIFALENNIERLALDHQHAAFMAAQLNDSEYFKSHGIEVTSQTNMVLFELPEKVGVKLAVGLADRGIRIYPGDNQRLVMHKDISTDHVEFAVEQITRVLSA